MEYVDQLDYHGERLNLNGEKLLLHDALIKGEVLKRKGRRIHFNFKCDYCGKPNRIPTTAVGKTSIICGKCNELNYIDYYYMVEF